MPKLAYSIRRLQVLAILIIACNNKLIAQECHLKNNYVGLMPSILFEPYDTINAVEVNLFPLLYEFRRGEKNDFGFQVRPILNYRFFHAQSGFSQIGGSLVANKYFLNIFDVDFWLTPQLGAFFTYAYNSLDKIQTMTLGIEPGVYLKTSKQLSLSLNLQPGINYYPDKFSRSFVESGSGFKFHLGIIFHVGYNF